MPFNFTAAPRAWRLLPVLAALAAGPALAQPAPAPATLPPAAPNLPGFTMDRTGDEHDFDFFINGGWTTVQRRLKPGANGAPDTWDTFPATQCLTPYLDGRATVDELYMPTKGRAGVTVRVFDRERKQWAIYFINGAVGRLDPIPVIGGFRDGRGEFYATDRVNDQPIRVRYLWTIKDANNARWEQAFSYDDRTWVTNWTADFTRTDRAAVCEDGKPKRG